MFIVSLCLIKRFLAVLSNSILMFIPLIKSKLPQPFPGILLNKGSMIAISFRPCYTEQVQWFLGPHAESLINYPFLIFCDVPSLHRVATSSPIKDNRSRILMIHDFEIPDMKERWKRDFLFLDVAS